LAALMIVTHSPSALSRNGRSATSGAGERRVPISEVPRSEARYPSYDDAQNCKTASNSNWASPSPELQGPPGQQPGQLPPNSSRLDEDFSRNSTPNEIRTDGFPIDPGLDLKFGADPNRFGAPAGQISNVPGTTASSPNSTSSLFGSGGRPIPLDEDHIKSRIDDTFDQ
jgi:hypothetical protein